MLTELVSLIFQRFQGIETSITRSITPSIKAAVAGFRQGVLASRGLKIGLLCVLCLSAVACQSTSGVEAPSPKSETLGVFIAAVPGFFVHGLGHYYAGDSVRFTELLEQEGYGVLFLSIAGALFFFGLSGVNKASDSSGGTRAFHGVTGTLSLIGAGLAGVLGVFLFFDSWFEDIYHTPAAVRRYNANLGPDAAALRQIPPEVLEDLWGDGEKTEKQSESSKPKTQKPKIESGQSKQESETKGPPPEKQKPVKADSGYRRRSRIKDAKSSANKSKSETRSQAGGGQ